MSGAAKAGEMDFAAIFDALPALCVVLEPDAPRFTILAATDAYLEAAMRTRDEIIGRGLLEAFPDRPGDEHATGTRNLRASLERAIATRAPDRMAIQAYPIRRPDGTWEDRSWSPLNAPVVDAATGRVTYIIHRVEDVTEAVRLGAERDRLRGERAESERRRAVAEDTTAELMQEREELERANTLLQDQAVELEVSNQRLQEQAGELEAQAEELQATTEELAERTAFAERATAELAESERQLRQMVDAIPTLAWTAKADGYIDWYNARWYAYTGTTPADMAGWGWQSVHDPEVLPDVLEQWARSITTGAQFEMIFPLRSADGSYRRFLTRVVPVTDASGQVVRWFGTNTDIEHERRAREGAEVANKAKSDFLSTMSHELRTPLNAIAGYAELLEMGLRGPVTEEQLSDLGRIRRAGRHLQSLINDILNFARLDAGRVDYRLRRVVVDEVLTDVESLVAPMVSARSLEYHRDGVPSHGALVAHADPEKLMQILLNLLTNAIKFTAPGGTITLGCMAPDERAYDVVRIFVADTGRGIPADELEHIFDPFVQVDRSLSLSDVAHQGVGLGLSISRGLARGMGGDLTVASELGAGSVFTLTLPVG